MEAHTDQPRHHQFPCRSCGANLVFAPGTSSLQCPYCGTTNAIARVNDVIEELDFAQHLRMLEHSGQTVDRLTVHCRACGADTTLPEKTTSITCPFCGSAVVVSQQAMQTLIKPASLLPFHITEKQACDAFKRWIHSLWFAPNALKKQYDRSGVRGVYVPAWTYDSETESDYTGHRGEDYWVTQTYTVTVNGRRQTRTRRVRKTRWYSARGRVRNTFDDILVNATTSLPAKHLDALQPWDLPRLVPFQEHYLAGFVAESYHIDLKQGFGIAQQIMDGPIRQSIRRDIGGDHQRIHTVDTRYYNVTFKHILLPVWISAYRFGDRTFRFLVNARTGEVQGERPYSWIKITLVVMMILVIIGIAVLLFAGGEISI